MLDCLERLTIASRVDTGAEMLSGLTGDFKFIDSYNELYSTEYKNLYHITELLSDAMLVAVTRDKILQLLQQ